MVLNISNGNSNVIERGVYYLGSSDYPHITTSDLKTIIELVAYLEGIYVKDKNRRKGIALALVKRAEEWGRENGCSEIASDCLLDNYLSIDFHRGAGFEEANRLVCFIKSI